MNLSTEFKGRDFLTLNDYTQEEIKYFLDVADYLKQEQRAGVATPVLAGKTLGMVFQKSSTRTRVSFEVGIYQLGGMGLFLSSNDLQIGRGEPVKDTARVLSRYLDGIMIRTFSHDEVVELARYSETPVINGLTDLLHPCQVLADLQTIREKFGTLQGLKLAFVGDGNNMAHSLMIGCAKMGMHVSIAAPAQHVPDEKVVASANQAAAKYNGKIEILNDPEAAMKDADVLYTDVWASMGQEEEAIARAKAFAGYQINQASLALAKEKAIVMHCLPAHRDEEITEEVIEGPQSVVFDEAENRLHAQKAIMALVM